MEFIETKNQSNIVSPRVKKAMGSFITWALLAQSYLGYGAIRPNHTEKIIEIKNYGTVLNPIKKEVSFVNSGEDKKENKDKKVIKSETVDEIVKESNRIPKTVKTVVAYKATLKEGTIGAFAGRKLDNPADNIFHIKINQQPTISDKVWLEYELNGLANAQSVSKSINDRLATGGYLVKTKTGWSKQSEPLNPVWLKKGDNSIQFSLPENAKYGYQIKNIRLIIEKSNNDEILVVEKNHTLYNNKGYVKGFIQGMDPEAQILVDGKVVIDKDGVFETMVSMETPRPVKIVAILSNGKKEEKILNFTKNDKADYTCAINNTHQTVSKYFEKGISNQLKIKGAELEVNEKALKGTEKISITTLRHIDLPALDMGMTNTTKDFKGYRFLPHGEHFKEGATVKLAYDRTKIPNGYTENDIKTYYFDTKTHHWVALERDSIDKKNQIIISKTTHFTDMINGVIQTPESPESQGFAPTSMSDIKAADPTAKIQVMAAPSANQRGSATTSYSFEMPPARNGMAPSLGIQYNSDGGSGWLGEGWDLNIPSITVDTRWGVPRYNGDLETETYSFNGSMLAMLDDEGNPAVAHRGDQISRKNNRRFYPRKEGSFSKIVRKGDGFGNTIWEVTDKKGTVYTYGGNGGVLKGKALEVGGSEKDVIVEWRLSKVEELHKDWIEYFYEPKEEEVKGTLKSKALYLTKVEAGQKGSGVITEVVITSNNKKVRKTNNARYGFLTSNHQLLDQVEVKFDGETLRSYGFTYDTGAFSKTRLKKITQYNSEGEEFNHHDLDYYNDVAYEKDTKTYKPFKTEQENLNPHDDGVKGEGVVGALGKASSLSGTQSKGNSFGLGLSVDFPSDKKFTCKGPLSVGGSFSYASSKGEGKLVLVDINGDGLADKVYKSGSSLFYRPNLTSNADENGYNSLSEDTDINIEYGDPVAIQGTSNFLKTKGKTTAGGFNIGYTSCSNFGVNAGVNIANSESETQVYFQDVNGDGLIDIVSKGAVLFNATDKDTGIVRFNQNSSLTPSPIAAGGTISSDVVKENVEEVWNQNVLEYPLHDVVRVWEAPFDGTVKIEGTVTLLAPQGTEDIDYDGDEYDEADGVQVSIDLGNQSNEGKTSNLWKKKLNKPENKATTVSETHTLTGKSVKKGQRVYFRVQSGNIERANGAFDQVDWNPIITYTDSKHHTGNNPDTQKVYSYKASEGFVVENDEPFTVFPKEYDHKTAVKIEGQFTKPVTSDAISVQVYKIDRIKENEEERVEKTLKWCKTFTSEETFDDLLTASFELASLEEGEDGHNLKIEFNSDTNIEWNKIQWDARMTQYDEGNYTKKNPRIEGKLIPSTTQEYLSSYIDVKENSLEEKVDYGNNVWWSSLFLDHKPFKEGKIEVTIDSSVNGQQYFMIGLSPETDKEKSYSYEGVDYALYNRNFSGQIYEKGNYINGVSFAVSSGDILSVELKDNKVNYFVNNQIVYTSHASSLDEKYVGHLVFYNPRNVKQNYGIGAKDIKITDYTTNSTISLESNESQPYHANYIKVENHIIKPLRQSSGKRIARLEYKKGFKEGRVDFDVSTGANLRHIVGLSDGEITTGYVNYAIKNTKYAIYLDDRNAVTNYFSIYENGKVIYSNNNNTYNQYYEDGETFSIEIVNGKVYYYKSSQEEPIYVSQNTPTAKEYNLMIAGTNEYSPTAYISNIKIANYANDNHNVSCDGSSNIESFGTPDGEETYPYVDYGVKAKHAIEGTWYMVQDIETDKLKVTPALTFTDTTKANGSVVLSVKSADQVQLLGKQTLTYVNGIVTPSVIPLEVEAEKGDQLWIEYTTEDVTFVGNINQGTTVKKNVNITELDTPLCITTPELNLSGQHTATQNYEAVTINSTATMNTAVEVEYKGGEVVHLKPSFHADSSNSGQFHAFIDDSNCGPDQVLLNDDVLGNVFTNIVNDKFGPMYRHWGQFVYNGNPDRLANPIDESLLVGSDDRYQTEEDIPELPTGVSETGKEYTTNELDTLSANNEYKPEDEIFVEMIPKLVVERNDDQSYQDIKPLWQGQDPESYIIKEEMSSTRLGEDDIRPFSVQLEEMLANVSTEGEGEGTICTLEGGMAYGVPKKTKTKSTSYALGGSTPVGGGSYSESNGSTEQLLDFMDVNGDRYPDVVGKSTIQYTETTGKLGSLSKAYEGAINESNNKSKGITAGGSYSHSGPVASATTTVTTIAVVNNNGSPKIVSSESQVVVADDSAKNASASFGLSGQVSENEDDAEHTFLDLNGDGLPDKLYKGGMVAINYGYHFGEKTEWGFNTIREGKSINVGGGINFGVANPELISNSAGKGSGSIQIGTGMSWSKTTVNYSITDVNSDGLPDLVRKVTIGVDDKGMDTEAKLMVSLNLGDRFASEIEWNGASQINQSRSFGMSGNLAFTVCIPILPPPLDAVKICVNPSGGLNTGFSRDEYQLTDIDADGFIDVVESNEEGELKTYRSTIARTNKLKSVTNPLGGRYTIDYAKSAATYDHPNGKWVMSSVEVDDGIHDDGTNIKTAFRYGKGKYDRHEREFLGFGKVMVESLDQNDVVYRTATQEFDVSDYYKAGNLTASYLEDKDGKKYTESTNEYYVYSVTDSTDDNYQFSVPTTVNEETNKPRICSDRGIGFTPMKYAESKAYEGQETAATLTQSFYEYYLNGHFGDLKSYKYTDKGTLSNTGSGSYNYMTSIEYKTYDKTNRIYGLPTRVKVQDQSGNVYRQTEATYQDGFANHITQVRQQLNDTDWAETDIEYDRYGNITKKTLPANAEGERMWYKYRYDRDYDMYVERIDDAFEYRTEFEEFDYRYGIPLVTRDYNDYEIHKTIDEYGRLETVTGPNELANGVDYTIAFEYHPIAEMTQNTQPATQNQIKQPAYAITKHYDEEHPGDDLETITFVDGTGRAIQVKKDGKITDKDNPTYSEHGLIVSGRAFFDDYGRVQKAYYPSWEHGFDNKTTFNTTFDAVTPTQTTYDVLDRAVVTKLPDGSETKMTYSTDNNTLLKTMVEDAEGGKKGSFTNGSGLTMKVEEYSGPDGTITTNYEYNPINELLKVIDTKGNEIVSTYDLAGRRTSVIHPDAGTSTFAYDTSSNLIEKQTANLLANDQRITYDYDYTRLVGVNYPEHPENNVKYYYGNKHANHNRIGRLVLQEDATGAQEFYYGRLGELTEVRRTLIVPNNAIATYVTKWRYDSWNRLQEMIYPDEEKITYDYNSGGLLESVKGEKTFTYNYVNQLGYDKFEQRTYLKYCNGAETKYTYENDRRRLSNLSVWDGVGKDKNSPHNQIMNNDYTYDKVSNVLKVQNSANAYESSIIVPITNNQQPGTKVGGSMTHTYTYDGLYRLKTGTGTFTGGNGKTAAYELTMGYDNLHNITSKKQTVEQSGIMFDGSLKNGYDLSYTYNTDHPHQMATVGDESYRTEGTNTQDPKQETHNYQYDPNGNLIYVNTARVKEDEHVEDSVHERKLLWDEENRLEAISDNGYVSNYWYDAAGERTVKTSGDGEGVYVQSVFAGGRTQTTDFTLYVNPYLVVRNGGAYTKHIYMGGQRIVSKLGDMDSYGEDPRRIEYAGSEAEEQKGESIMPDYEAKYKLSYEVMKARYDSLQVPYHGTDNDDYQGGTGFCCDPVTSSAEGVSRSSRVAQNENPELYQYYYHADHLGSSSYITDLNGEVAQHIEYVPFGEVFIEERNNTWNTPYLFNGKELDEETGLYYYGARYYNPRVSQWLSVDAPLINGYYLDFKHDGGVLNSFNLGAYAYTRNNPVVYVDPDGNQYVTRTISYSSNGNITSVTDILHYKHVKQTIANQRSRRNFVSNPYSGPLGPGIRYVHINSEGEIIRDKMKFNDKLGNHGLYSGAGCITKYGIDGQNYDMSMQPVDIADAIAKVHDQSYPNDETYNKLGFTDDTRTLRADRVMLSMIDQALDGKTAQEIGTEVPFNEMLNPMTNRNLNMQKIFIGALAHYKQWKIDNYEAPNEVKFEDVKGEYADSSLKGWANSKLIEQAQ